MTVDKVKLKALAEATKGWDKLTDAWVCEDDVDETDADLRDWVVGRIDEDGNPYPVATVCTWQYDAPSDAEKLAKYYAAANPAAILELLAENKGQAKKIKWDESWYGTRFETLFHWAHRELNEEQKTQYFNIVANGSSSPLDPPTYAQQMNSLKWKVEAAEKERDMLRVELEAMRKDAERYRFFRDSQQVSDNGDGWSVMYLDNGAGGLGGGVMQADFTDLDDATDFAMSKQSADQKNG